jgi:uncharacterized membrane protein YdjX (TVP38/TMEM64 family)
VRLYARLFGLLCLALLALFGVASALGFEELLGDPRAWVGELGLLGALASVGLLWADVLLPVPSSPLMVANGLAFGLLPGALVSLVGGVGATLLAWYLGWRYQERLLGRMSEQERSQAERLLTKWGGYAIVMTRPIPILAEAVALLSGTLPLSASRVALYATVGHLLPSLGYAYLGGCLRGAL